MAKSDPFSTSTMLDSLQQLDSAVATEPMNPAVPSPPPVDIPTPAVIQPRETDLLNSFFAALTTQEMEIHLQSLFNLMTNSEEDKPSLEFIISMLDQRQLHRMAYSLTSDSDYFLNIARNKNGSKRMQKLLGKSDSLQHLDSVAATEPVNPAVPPSTPAVIPPRETNLLNSFSAALTTQELEIRSQSLFNLMTNSEEDKPPLKFIISRLDKGQLHTLASSLTSDSDYFLNIARNKNGSIRMQKLLGKSDDVDALFCAAILRIFPQVMTDRYASNVAKHGLRVFNEEKKVSIYDHTLHEAPHMACDPDGSVALKYIITDFNHPYYRNKLLDIVVYNALWLSHDLYGNFVVQHVLQLNDLRRTRDISDKLRGYCVDLSFKKHGSYVVQKLLDTEESMVMVVDELLLCGGGRLLKLASSEFGNFVVNKALRVTRGVDIRDDLFWGLVDKLMPFLHSLRTSHGRCVAKILKSIR